jgi:hypothetical protein
MNTTIGTGDMTTIAIIQLYYIFIGRDYLTLILWTTIAAIASWFLCIFVLPESPKLLLAQGKAQKAINVLNYIAKINGSTSRIPQDAQFEESLPELNRDESIAHLSNQSTRLQNSGMNRVYQP